MDESRRPFRRAEVRGVRGYASSNMPEVAVPAMRISARDLVVGNILHVNDRKLHIIRIERERGLAVLTAEFDFLMHFEQDDFVTVQERAAAA